MKQLSNLLKNENGRVHPAVAGFFTSILVISSLIAGADYLITKYQKHIERLANDSTYAEHIKQENKREQERLKEVSKKFYEWRYFVR